MYLFRLTKKKIICFKKIIKFHFLPSFSEVLNNCIEILFICCFLLINNILNAFGIK